MKKCLFNLFLFVFGSSCLGQTNVYQPFPLDSAAWFGTTQFESGITNYDFTEWLGDTVINSISYTKIYNQHNFSSLTYGGGIRQDIPNEKIYQIDLNNIEHDMAVSQHGRVGETCPQLLYTYSAKVISIDSVLVGAQYHKQYHLQSINPNINPLSQGKYIVGVGFANESVFAESFQLYCFSVKNVNQFGGAPECYLISKINLIHNPYSISLSPNPSSETTILTTTLSNYSVEIYNLFGQRVKQIKGNSNQTEIYRGSLPNGLYIVRLIQNNKIVASTKLIIVDK